MNITLDQAEALEAVATLGTVQKAAGKLHKGHSAVLYLIKTLEEQTGLTLFDRKDYRNRLNPNGELVLKYCRELLATKGELEAVCNRLKGGWEAELQLIYDGVIDFRLLADALKVVSRQEIPTDIRVRAEYLREVESEFVEKKADIMVTVVPIRLPGIESISLNPIEMQLVAEKKHSLHRLKSGRRIKTEDLLEHPFIMVRETADTLGLSTEGLPFRSIMAVGDFSSKREAILRGLGFGWLPDYLIEKQLKSGELKVLKTEISNHHRLFPKLYHYKKERLGRGAEFLVKHFLSKYPG